MEPKENGTASILRADGLVMNHGGVRVLDGLSLEVKPGEMLCLLGKNGAGKTTTLHLFLGFMRPAAGSAQVASWNAATHPHEARARIAYVPETVALYEHLNAVENVEYFLAAGGRTNISKSEIVAKLSRAGMSEDATWRPARAYSKGMRQKVVIALALAKNAQALLLDEPSTGLDPKATEELSAITAELRAQGVAILAATHDLAWVHATADRVGIIQHGKILETTKVSDQSPESLASLYLTGVRAS